MAERLLIFGPPGCGKTHTLIELVREALANGVSPWRIAFVSFTKKAVAEALGRACTAFDLQPKQLPYFRTLHSLGFHGLGMTRDAMMGGPDWKLLGHSLGVAFDGIEAVSPDDGVLIPSVGGNGLRYIQMHDRARYRMVTVEQEFREANDYDLSFAKLRQTAQALEMYKSTYGKADFVDLIDKYPDLADIPVLDLLIVDEAQDLTPLQWRMVDAIAAKAKRCVFAGDDDQAIHAWTGVDVSLFLDSAEARRVLSQSYRLPRAVFDVSQKLVKRIRHREPKAFLPTEREGSVTYHMSLDTIPFHEGSWTVMARTNGFVNMFREWFEEAGYLYSVKGRPSINEKLAASIDAWRRLQRGDKIPLPLVKTLYENLPKQGPSAAVRRGAMTLLDAADPMQAYGHGDLVSDFGLLAPAENDALDVVKMTSDDRLYIAALERRGEDITAPPRIKLSTFHAMKGGEDDNCVVYLGTTKACATEADPDDEHRAFYVGVTRARENLHILDTDRRYRYDL